MRIHFPALVILVLSLLVSACSSPQTMENTYKFRPLSDRKLVLGTSKLLLPDSAQSRAAFSDLDKYGPYAAAFRGSLLRLFGGPLHISDAQYDYIIEASDTTDHIWILTAYEGASGPAIGGNSRDQSIYPVAISLRDLIERTPPADFEDVYYSEEYDTTITYGCKDGACYYREERGNHVPHS